MSEIHMLVTIANRNHAQRFMEFYNAQEIRVTLATLGAGTANSETLNLFGLEATEKAVMFSFLTGETWKKMKPDLYRKMLIDVPGVGIAFIVPLSSIGGKRLLNYFVDNQNFEKGEEQTLKETKHEVIVAIANHGYIDALMDAARSAGAGGGTVIHAKGTGMAGAEKFLGVSLATEKEMVFIVAAHEKKNDIMKAIMQEAGTNTKTGALCFSLPVTDTAGLRLFDDMD